MLPTSALRDRSSGRLADNVVHFTRVLRKAGLPVGTDRTLLALEALQIAGIGSRRDFHATLRACLIDRGEHRALFDQAFEIFWKDPDLLAQVLRLLLPRAPGKSRAGSAVDANRRLAAALTQQTVPTPQQPTLQIEPSWSDREQLRKADFETMTTDEWLAAKRMIPALEPLLVRVLTRRSVPDDRGARIDFRQLLRDTARRGGQIVNLPRRRRRTRPSPLVVIVDISGSMSRYSRMFLHFVHAVTSGPHAAAHRVQAFVFGTQLTHITRQLGARDPDEAIARVAGCVSDWSGGTRLGECLREFNRHWARRVLGSDSTVLLVTDGLERGALETLDVEAERLTKSCRRLIWLNPLLRYDAFEPRAGGIAIMLRHADRLLPVHNLESLQQLAEVLASGAQESQRWK